MAWCFKHNLFDGKSRRCKDHVEWNFMESEQTHSSKSALWWYLGVLCHGHKISHIASNLHNVYITRLYFVKCIIYSLYVAYYAFSSVPSGCSICLRVCCFALSPCWWCIVWKTRITQRPSTKRLYFSVAMGLVWSLMIFMGLGDQKSPW